jgi:tRNA(Ile)-lysidine synthase
VPEQDVGWAAGIVAGTISRHAMLGLGDRVLAAYSGGADSTALAILLNRLGYRVVLGHIDHGLRSDGAAEAGHCATVAAALGVPMIACRVAVDPPTQAEARRVRYAALGRMAAVAGISHIATGHTLDDQAETVELRRRRGGFGLGIPPTRGNVVRPILELRRAETERVCFQAGLRYLNDPSNSNQLYARARVRSELAAAGPERFQDLVQAGEQAGRAARATRQAAARLSDRGVTRSRGEAGIEVRIERSALKGADPGAIRQLIHDVGDELEVELSARLVRDILSKVAFRTGAELQLPAGLSVWAEPNHLVMGPAPQAPILPVVELSFPGVAECSEWGLRVQIGDASPSEPPAPSLFNQLFDLSAFEGFLAMRQWAPGDRFRPLGAPGRRKLQDFFVDQHVPRRRRPLVPIITDGNRIAWVVGHRIEDGFKLTAATTRVVKISVSPA